MINDNILTLMTFVPLIGAVLILFLPQNYNKSVKILSLIFTAIPLLLCINIYSNFNTSTSNMQFVEHYEWIKSFNIEYFMGIDGLSVSMVLLTALLSFICIIASWNIDKAIKGYFSLFLLLETGMLGTFCALDFFLFFIFWEVMLLPMYFLIGIWGGPRREYAAIKFFLYTLFGSVLILLSMLAFYFYNGQHTFNMLIIMKNSATYLKSFQIAVFIALFIGFAIKVPVFPFHTWLPDAHVEAPTAISVILAGILLKNGDLWYD